MKLVKEIAQVITQADKQNTPSVFVEVSEVWNRAKKSVGLAVKGEIANEGKWIGCAPDVVECFLTFDNLLSCKARVINEWILPNIKPDQYKAFVREYPRKGSKAWAALPHAEQVIIEKEWEPAKINARAQLTVFYNRMCKYAFPDEWAAYQGKKTKAKSESAQVTDSDIAKTLAVKVNAATTKQLKLMAAFVSNAQKDTAPEYDVPNALRIAKELIAVLAKPISK